MAKYTIELKDVVRNGYNIFDFNYPFYDENKRKEFEEKFIRHFYFREIGAETIDRFLYYLEDKMTTVFPYYNELFKTSLINYDKVYNYDMTEEYKRNSEMNGNSRNVSSSVGTLQNTQEATSTQKQVIDSLGNVVTIGSDTEEENGTTTTNATGSSNTNTTGSSSTENSEETSAEKSSSTSSSGTNNKTVNNTVNKKFLDTPQGLTDLTNSKYLTTLNQDTTTGTETDTNSTTGTGSENSSSNSSSSSETDTTTNAETNTTDNSETTNEKSVERDSTVSQDSTGKETTDNNISSTVSDEQKRTDDNNTISSSKNTSKEDYVLTRKGNIGVQTASDMLEKHIELQKKLQKIELMFFDECEDLFMLVF